MLLGWLTRHPPAKAPRYLGFVSEPRLACSYHMLQLPSRLGQASVGAT